MKLTDRQLRRRDAARDIGAEVLESVRDIKAGKGERTKVAVPAAAEARRRVGVSQAEFARLLGVSVRTLQDWEQGSAQPDRGCALPAGRRGEAAAGAAPAAPRPAGTGVTRRQIRRTPCASPARALRRRRQLGVCVLNASSRTRPSPFGRKTAGTIRTATYWRVMSLSAKADCRLMSQRCKLPLNHSRTPLKPCEEKSETDDAETFNH